MPQAAVHRNRPGRRLSGVRRCATVAASVVGALILAAPAAFAATPPPNDNFPGQTISGPSGTVVGTFAGATPQPGEVHSSNRTIWYSWTAPADGTAVFQTCPPPGVPNDGYDGDTLMVISVGDTVHVNANTNLVSLDQRCFRQPGYSFVDNRSFIRFKATHGTTYRIQLADVDAVPRTTVDLFWKLSGADLALTLADSPNPVVAGQELFRKATVRNPSAFTANAPTVEVTVTSPTAFISVTKPTGWTCTSPPFGGQGTVHCSGAGIAAAGSATVEIALGVNRAAAAGSVITGSAKVTSIGDPNPANNSASTKTTVRAG